MNKTGIITALTHAREAREKWGTARAEFFSAYETVLTRLLHEACANFMGDTEIARHLGVSPASVRKMMRARGLTGRSQNVLSKTAAEALANNAALLGIEPAEMDLMSPLAYLPMGSEMRKQIAANAVSQVRSLEEDLALDPCGAKHPYLTVVSRCIQRGEHTDHLATFGDGHNTIAMWAVQA